MADLKVWSKILINDDPFEIIRLEHVKTGRGWATDKCVAKNILTGAIINHSFHDINQVQFADIQMNNGEYLYSDGDEYHFMNTETYDQFPISQERIGDTVKLLKEWCKVLIQLFNGNPINIGMEPAIELEVSDTPPGEKGDTATGGKKPAILETGLVIQVPLFIKPGDIVRVDTRTLEYMTRV